MKYSELCETYKALEETTKGLEKTEILARFLDKLKLEKSWEVVYLLKGLVFADYDERELGISHQLSIKAISSAVGVSSEEVVSRFKELGDLGKVAEELVGVKKQVTLSSSDLDVERVLKDLRKLPGLEGKGTVDKKLGLIIGLLNASKPVEARYIVRSVLGDLKIGVGDGILRDAIVESCFSPKDVEEKKEKVLKVQGAYDKSSDFAEIFEKACSGKLNEIKLSADKPIKVMLFPKAADVEDAFRIVGRPAAFEFKYDGFRVMINKNEEGEIKIFTRRLDNVTNQFPDVVEYVKENVKGKSFILDGEVVGFNPETEKAEPFQAISQRIRRKYDIERLVKKLPVEILVFDVVYYEGESFIETSFKERRELIEKIVKTQKLKIGLAEQIVSDDEKVAEEFYKKSLDEGQEGLMVKGLNKPYKPGARIGYAVKLKPEDNDFDLVITGAEWGTGKRAGWLTSFDVSCLDEKTGELKEIGKVSTGLKEKEEEGVSFMQLTKELQKNIEREDGRHVYVKPKIVVTVQFQNVQQSPTYSSGYALRFPRIKALRPDRTKNDIATLDEVGKGI
jgi:DNA ligase 1